MKVSHRAGLVGLMLALCGTMSPKAGAAPDRSPSQPENEQPSVDARLGALGEAVRNQEGQIGSPLETSDGTKVVAQGFLNYATTFRNNGYGFRNAVPGWYNIGVWNNNGIHFLNSAPAFRNYYGGWRNAYPG